MELFDRFDDLFEIFDDELFELFELLDKEVNVISNCFEQPKSDNFTIPSLETKIFAPLFKNFLNLYEIINFTFYIFMDYVF